MKIAAALSLLVVTPIPWSSDWTFGLPLIVLTLVIHVLGLLFIDEKVARVKKDVVERYGYRVVFVVIIGATAM
jgi:steroid 5-alpha reductase family enzyme